MGSDDAPRRFTFRVGESPAMEIVSNLASARGVDPLRLEPLQDAVAVDALDALLTRSPSGSESDLGVEFSYAGALVTARSDGTVTVIDHEPGGE